MGLAGSAAAAAPATAAPPAPKPTTAQLVAQAAAAQAPPPQPAPVEVPPGGFHGKDADIVSERLDKRTPASRTYVTRRGTLATLYYTAPIEYRDPAGAWHLIDPTLVSSAGGGWHNAADAASLSLPTDLAVGSVSVASPTATMSFSLNGAAAAAGSEVSDTVTYPAALPGVDVAYRSLPNSLKETLTLSGPAAQRRFVFTTSLSAGASIRPEPGKGRSLQVVDTAGNVALGLPAPTMVDAAGAGSNAVALSAGEQAGQWQISLVPDATWLDAPERRWPVTIDPNVSYTVTDLRDTYLSSSNPFTDYTSATTYQVGHVASTGESDRALISFPDLFESRLPDITVLDAQLWMTQKSHTTSNTTSISIYPVLQPWSGPSWNYYDSGGDPWQSPGAGGAGVDYSTPAAYSRSGGSTNTDWIFYPRAVVQSWFNASTLTDGFYGATPMNGFLLKADETVDNQLTFYSSNDSNFGDRFSLPYLFVEYTATVGLNPLQTYGSHKIDDREQLNVNANGNLVISANDYSTTGVGLNFGVSRAYNSRTTPAGEPFSYDGNGDSAGAGWSAGTGPDVGLYWYDDAGTDRGVNFTGPNGVDTLFTPASGACPQYPSDPTRSFYTAPPGVDADLCYNPSANTFTMTYHASQQTLVFQSEVSAYPLNYQVVSETDRNANTITYGYDASGNWTGVTDTVGRTYSVSETSGGRISSIAESNFSGGTDGSGNPAHRSVAYGYDSSGTLLTSVTDATGAVTSYHYTTGNDVLIDKITDPVGNQITFTYDTWQRVTSMTYVTNNSTGAGDRTTFTYNPNLLQKQQGDFESAAVSGWVTGTAAAIATTTAAHLDGSRALQVTANSGSSMDVSTPTGTTGVPVTPGQTYAAEVSAKAASTGATLEAEILFYNSAGTLLSTIGNAAGYALGEVSGSWGTSGVVATAPANAAYAALDVAYPSYVPGSIHYLDDASFNVWPGDGLVWNTHMDIALPTWTEGLPNSLMASCTGVNATEVTSPNNNPTLYCYDATDRVGLAVDALGHSNQATFNPDNKQTTQTNAQAAVAYVTYTAVNTPSATAAPASGSGATAAQNAIGNSAPNPNPSCTSNCSTAYKYLPSSTTDPQGSCTAYTYDGAGNRTNVYSGQASNCDGHTAGNRTATNYQGDSGVSSCTSDGLTTTHAGVMCSTTYANQSSTTNTTTYAYTFSSAAPKTLTQVLVTQPGGTCSAPRNLCTTTTYDADGRVATSIDSAATGGGTGNKTTSCYDNLDRVTRLYVTASSASPTCTSSGPTYTYTYDADGNQTQLAGPSGTMTYGYDQLGRMVTKYVGGAVVCTATVNSVTLNGTVCSGYDADSNLTSFTDSSGITVYAFDAADRVTSLVQPGGTAGCTITPKVLQSGCTAFAYDSANRRTVTQYPGGATMNATYDNAGNLTQAAGVNNFGTTLTQFTYCYQVLAGSGTCPASGGTNVTINQKTIESDPRANLTTYYAYDPSNELCGAGPNLASGASSLTCGTVQPGDNSYTYDAAGNRTQQTVGATTTYLAYNGANELCWKSTSAGNSCSSPPIGAATWSFDGNGNLSAGTSPSESFGYDAQNQTTAITARGVTLTAVTYAEIDQSERTSVTNGSSTSSYLSSPLGLDASSDSSGSTHTIRDPWGGLIGYLDAAGRNWYYLLDGPGSVVAVINGSGSTVANRYAYDEWGQVTYTLPNPQVTQPYGYAGGYTDPTGFVHFGARYYDPTVGRWTQQDSVSAVNLYTYAHNDPVNDVDPTGMFSLNCDWWHCRLILDQADAYTIAAFGGLLGGLASKIPNVVSNWILVASFIIAALANYGWCPELDWLTFDPTIFWGWLHGC